MLLSKQITKIPLLITLIKQTHSVRSLDCIKRNLLQIYLFKLDHFSIAHQWETFFYDSLNSPSLPIKRTGFLIETSALLMMLSICLFWLHIIACNLYFTHTNSLWQFIFAIFKTELFPSTACPFNLHLSESRYRSSNSKVLLAVTRWAVCFFFVPSIFHMILSSPPQTMSSANSR